MMINSVSSASTFVQTSAVQNSNSQSSTLSAYQKQSIGTLLENYDASNLSAKDAVEIVNALKDEGIAPSKELASVIADAGFNAKEIGDLAGVSGGGAAEGGRPAGGPPPPRQGGNQSSEEEQSYLSELLDSLLSVDTTENTTTTSSSATVNGVSFSDVMDYTSRIVNLNTQSQEQVMSMLDDLSSKDNQLTNEQKSSVVKYNLGQILSNSENYNRVSLYA